MDRKPSYFVLVACLGLALATLIVYSRSVRNPFLHVDDPDYVTENAHVKAGLTWETFSWALTATTAQNWHLLTWLSHALDCQLYGLNPKGHHFTNARCPAAKRQIEPKSVSDPAPSSENRA